MSTSKRGLPAEEIKRRLIRLRNLEYLHEQQRFKIWNLRDANRELKKEVVALKAVVGEQQRTIDDLKLRLEELSTIVFGKKRKKEENYDIDDDSPKKPVVNCRTPESYRRSLPKKEEVTKTEPHTIDTCNHCDGNISEKETLTYFVEDIPLPQKKIVIRHVVEKGYCETCDCWMTKEPLPPATVTLGPNVKRYVTYLSVICRQSYGQIQQILDHTYDFDISQGEIAKILNNEGESMRPEYERLKAKIRGEPSIHLDETGWNLVMGDGYKRYAWNMTGKSGDSVFVLGKTRGKGNATDLVGDSKAVVVSDDYAAYRNMENPHQLCCAHIMRKLRDLATSSEISGNIHEHCVSAYTVFKQIYMDIENARTSTDPQSKYDLLHARLKSFSIPDPSDPAKLIRIKEQISARSDNYLTCLLHKDVACDNNAAERSLRHLVLKRKISFGSFKEKTAETLAILASVLLSRKQNGTLAAYLRGV
ncbi:MAG: IS66 family transposase [Patescibacteria group bacterium]|nr:IS66 family transposase [Patescibacteria group bacterium]